MKKNENMRKLSAYLHYEESHITGVIDGDGRVTNWADLEAVEALKQEILEQRVENAVVDVRGHIRLIEPQYQACVLDEAEEKARERKVTEQALHKLLGEPYVMYPEKFYQYGHNGKLMGCSLTKDARIWIESQENAVVPMPMLHYKGEEVKSYQGLFQNLKLQDSLDISHVNSHYVTDMTSMFENSHRADLSVYWSHANITLPEDEDKCRKHSFFLLGFESLSTTFTKDCGAMFKKTYLRFLDLRNFEVCSMKSVFEFWEYAFFGELLGEEVFRARIQTEDILTDFPLQFFDMGKYV